jgi:hypothetical protein
MSTPVSWIDPEHLQTLLSRLEPVSLDPQTVALEVAAATFLISEEKREPEVEFIEPEVASQMPHEVDSDLDEEPANTPQTPPEGVQQLRERLQALRERAQHAGVFTKPIAEPTSPAPQSSNQPLPMHEWAQQVLDALPSGAVLLVIAADGELMWSNDPRPGLALSAVMACRARHHGSINAASMAQEPLHLPMPPAHVLSLFSITADSEPLTLAVKAKVEVKALKLPLRPLASATHASDSDLEAAL